jgi:hypothetical protein
VVEAHFETHTSPITRQRTHGILVPRMRQQKAAVGLMGPLQGCVLFVARVLHQLLVLLHQRAAHAAAGAAKVLTATALGPDVIRVANVAPSDALHQDGHEAQGAQGRMDKVGAEVGRAIRSAVKASWNGCLIITEGDVADDARLPHQGQILRINHTGAHEGQRP